jgi:hypothetical protein
MICNKKIIVLILSARSPRYRKFIESVDKSWALSLTKLGVRCFFYSGGWDKDRILGNQVQLNCSDLIGDVSEKLVRCINLLNKSNFKYDLIFRTNLSSYINPENFIAFINNRNLNKDSYRGFIGQTTYLKAYFFRRGYISKLLGMLDFIFPKKIFYASGSGCFIGRNLANSICEKGYLYFRFCDDIMIGLLYKNNVSNLIRFDLKADFSHRITKSAYRTLTCKKLLFHYRFKTNDRNKDSVNLLKFKDPVYREDFCTLSS